MAAKIAATEYDPIKNPRNTASFLPIQLNENLSARKSPHCDLRADSFYSDRIEIQGGVNHKRNNIEIHADYTSKNLKKREKYDTITKHAK